MGRCDFFTTMNSTRREIILPEKNIGEKRFLKDLFRFFDYYNAHFRFLSVP
jgi:hypothetical protein